MPEHTFASTLSADPIYLTYLAELSIILDPAFMGRQSDQEAEYNDSHIPGEDCVATLVMAFRAPKDAAEPSEVESKRIALLGGVRRLVRAVCTLDNTLRSSNDLSDDDLAFLNSRVAPEITIRDRQRLNKLYERGEDETDVALRCRHRQLTAAAGVDISRVVTKEDVEALYSAATSYEIRAKHYSTPVNFDEVPAEQHERAREFERERPKHYAEHLRTAARLRATANKLDRLT